jgi:tRNA (adenine57-N1/adenine58-N1)-methyltransferase
VSVTPEASPPSSRSLLRDQEAIVLIDRKERIYLRVLRRGGQVRVRGVPIACDELIGQPEGTTVETLGGESLLVLRPTYAQLIPSLPRRAEPIYPKDTGPILLWGDIGPGMDVVEVGTGPGALTLALLRAVGPTGHLTSYEARDDFATTARDNVARYHGPAPNWTLRVADVFAGIVERDVDRMTVDLAEPWRLLPQVFEALRPGGVLTAFLPTVLQVKQLVDALRGAGFGAVETLETLVRFWHVRDRSIRPTHRMVAHTGFLVFARRLAHQELTPYRPCSTADTVHADGACTPAPTRDDEGGDPPEGLADDSA